MKPSERLYSIELHVKGPRRPDIEAVLKTAALALKADDVQVLVYTHDYIDGHVGIPID